MHPFFSTHKRTFLALTAAFLYASAIAYATPPASQYNPAETLDPSCAPGDTNCSVSLYPDQTGNSGAFLTTNGTTVSWATIPASTNIYNSDGTLTGTRTLTTAGNRFTLSKDGSFRNTISGSLINFQAATDAGWGAGIVRYGNSGSPSDLIFVKTRGATASTDAALVNNDFLFRIAGFGVPANGAMTGQEQIRIFSGVYPTGGVANFSSGAIPSTSVMPASFSIATLGFTGGLSTKFTIYPDGEIILANMGDTPTATATGVTSNRYKLQVYGNSSVHGNFLINTTQGSIADASAIADIVSTTKGVLLPRMTNAERAAIATPATGLLAYSTDATEGLYVNLSGGWQRFLTTADSASFSNIYTADGSLTGARTLTLNSNPLDIAGTSTTRFFSNGNVGVGTTTDAGYKLDVNGSSLFRDDISLSIGQNIYLDSAISKTGAGSITMPRQGGPGPGTFFTDLATDGWQFSSGNGSYLTIRESGTLNPTGGLVYSQKSGLGSTNVQLWFSGLGSAPLFTIKGGGSGPAGGYGKGADILIAGGNGGTANAADTYGAAGILYLAGGDANNGTAPDFAGAGVHIQGGRGTGTGAPGDILFSTSTAGASGTVLQTLSERARFVGANGNLLLGTATDNGFKLQVAGTARVYGELSAWGGGFRLNRTGAEPYFVFHYNDSQVAQIRSMADGTLRFTDGAGGTSRVEIGGSSVRIFSTLSTAKTNLGGGGAGVPSAGIYHATASTPDGYFSTLFLRNTNAVEMIDGFGVGMDFQIEDPTQGPIVVGSIGAVRMSADNSGALIFRTTNAGNLLEKARVTNDGNLLVGTTTNAGYKLDVNGTGRFSQPLTISSTTNIQLNVRDQFDTLRYTIGRDTGTGALTFSGSQTTFSSYVFGTTAASVTIANNGDISASNLSLSSTISFGGGSSTFSRNGGDGSMTLALQNFAGASFFINGPHASSDVTVITGATSGAQLRLRYDGSNHTAFSVGSTGNTTMALTGTAPSLSITNLTIASSSQDALCIVNGGTEVQRNNGAQTCTVSSSRFKHDIQPLSGDILNTLSQFTPSTFIYNDQTNLRIGLIAEEVATIDPRLVFYEEDGVTPRGVRYEDLSVLTLKGVQEIIVTTTTLTDLTKENSLRAQLSSWLGDVANGLENITAGRIRARQEVCIDDVCINKEQLRALIENQGQPVVSAPSSTPEPLLEGDSTPQESLEEAIEEPQVDIPVPAPETGENTSEEAQAPLE